MACCSESEAWFCTWRLILSAFQLLADVRCSASDWPRANGSSDFSGVRQKEALVPRRIKDTVTPMAKVSHARNDRRPVEPGGQRVPSAPGRPGRQVRHRRAVAPRSLKRRRGKPVIGHLSHPPIHARLAPFTLYLALLGFDHV